MNAEDNFLCPKCGAVVSRGDKFCKNCGEDLRRPSETLQLLTAPPPAPLPETAPVQPPYERKFSMVQRFYKLLISPSDAMQDIALAPDYGGVIVIVALQFIVTVVALWEVIQKLQLVGPPDRVSIIWGFLIGILSAAMIFAGVLIFVFWLVKSFLVKFFCDSGSDWSFRTAASVTGYAYIADLIFSILGIFVLFLLPQLTIDLSNLDVARQTIANYRAQLSWNKVLFTLPFSLVGLLWKSYLGSLGTRFGTKEKCSLSTAFVVFFVFGLIGLLISFISG